jgi:signal transduction histidine kinase/ActR/RegA family two-component response regulator
MAMLAHRPLCVWLSTPDGRISVANDTASEPTPRSIYRIAREISTRVAASGPYVARVSLDGAVWIVAASSVNGDSNQILGCIFPWCRKQDKSTRRPNAARLVAAAISWALKRRIRLNHRLRSQLASLISENESLKTLHGDVVAKAIREHVSRRKEHRRTRRTARMQRLIDATTRLKNEFLATVSHELRTPMTAILGFAEVLQESILGIDDREAVDTIRRNGEYLLDIINELLDLSQTASPRVDVKKTRCAATEILMSVACERRKLAMAKGLQLNVAFDSPIPETILTDPTRLRQLLSNLVGNAVKLTDSGSVQIVGRCVDEAGGKSILEVDIIDTGPGMPPEQIAHLFPPRGYEAQSKFRGAGLELAVSRRLLELLYGTITVRSAPGRGTAFTVRIPTGPLDGVRRIQPPIVVPYRTQGRVTPQTEPLLHGRILLAEDGPDNQRLITFVLKKAGADVTVAHNGLEAVEMVFGGESMAAQPPFDLVLMDLQMPTMDGFEATQELRNRGFEKPIIALSAHVMKSAIAQAIEAGCNEYLCKPINRQSLLQTVRRHLERQNPELLAGSAAAGH